MRPAHPRRAGQRGERVTQRNVIEGLQLVQKAISDTLAQALVKFIRAQLRDGKAGKLVGHTFLECSNKHALHKRSTRLQLQYGCRPFNYITVGPDEEHICEGIPPVLQRLMAQLVDVGMLAPGRMHTFIINAYRHGDWIPPHTDHAAYGSTVVGVSLGDTASLVLGSPHELRTGGSIYDERTGTVDPRAIADGRE